MCKDVRFDLNVRCSRRFDKLCCRGQDIRTTTQFGVYLHRMICVYVNYAAGLDKQMCNACELFIKNRNYCPSGRLRVCTSFVEQPRTTVKLKTRSSLSLHSRLSDLKLLPVCQLISFLQCYRAFAADNVSTSVSGSCRLNLRNFFKFVYQFCKLMYRHNRELCTVHFVEFYCIRQTNALYIYIYIYINSICFLKHCYMFRCLYIILRESLIMYAEVTKLTFQSLLVT